MEQIDAFSPPEESPEELEARLAKMSVEELAGVAKLARGATDTGTATPKRGSAEEGAEPFVLVRGLPLPPEVVAERLRQNEVASLAHGLRELEGRVKKLEGEREGFVAYEKQVVTTVYPKPPSRPELIAKIIHAAVAYEKQVVTTVHPKPPSRPELIAKIVHAAGLTEEGKWLGPARIEEALNGLTKKELKTVLAAFGEAEEDSGGEGGQRKNMAEIVRLLSSLDTPKTR